MIKIDVPLYFENNRKMIYRLSDFEAQGNGIAYLNLELECGYDYINPDNSSAQGYVNKDNFIEETHHEMVSCDLFAESFVEALKSDGYHALETLPKIFIRGSE